MLMKRMDTSPCMNLTQRVRGRRRGYIFVLTLVVFTTLIVLGLVSISMAINARALSARKERGVRAMELAEGAAWSTKGYLETLGTPPDTSVTNATPLSYPTNGGWTTLTNGGKFQAKIKGIPNTQPQHYWIIATGKTSDGETRKVVMQVQVSNFAKYAYFENTALPGGWMITGMRYDGPVHSNDTLSIFWDQSTGHPIFGDTVESAKSSVAWWDSSHTPKTDADWRNVFDAGQTALKLGAKSITIPSSTLRQKHNAWKGSVGFADSSTATPNPPYPSSTGVYLGSSGDTSVSAGIYVVGDSSMLFSIDNVGRQVITFTQGSTTTAITADPVNNQTLVSVNGHTPPTSLSGYPNGLIYSTGNITSVKGTLADNVVTNGAITARNAWTVATDISNSKDITITGDLVYKTQPDLSGPTNTANSMKAATLGLYGRNINIGNIADHPNYQVNGVVMAANGNTGTWQAANINYHDSKGNAGNVYLTGGVINYAAGCFGYFNPSNGQMSSGYAEHYAYDRRMATAPPPFFPITGLYDVDCWQEM